jgi:hypothetical protein
LTDDDIFRLHKKGCPNRNKRAAKEEQSDGTMLDVIFPELRVLLTRHQVMVLSRMKKDARTEKLNETLQSQKYAPIFMKWSADD